MAMRSAMALWDVQLLVQCLADILVSELSMLLETITTVFVLEIVEMVLWNKLMESIVMMVTNEVVIVVTQIAK